MQGAATNKPAGHRISQLPIGRTHTYELIRQGKLKARKSGRATIIVNWDEYLADLPEAKGRSLKRKWPGTGAPSGGFSCDDQFRQETIYPEQLLTSSCTCQVLRTLGTPKCTVLLFLAASGKQSNSRSTT
jgi:hypothetical protein